MSFIPINNSNSVEIHFDFFKEYNFGSCRVSGLHFAYLFSIILKKYSTMLQFSFETSFPLAYTVRVNFFYQQHKVVVADIQRNSSMISGCFFISELFFSFSDEFDVVDPDLLYLVFDIKYAIVSYMYRFFNDYFNLNNRVKESKYLFIKVRMAIRTFSVFLKVEAVVSDSADQLQLVTASIGVGSYTPVDSIRETVCGNAAVKNSIYSIFAKCSSTCSINSVMYGCAEYD